MKKITMLLVGVLVSTFAFASEPGPGSSSAGLSVVKQGESTFKLYYQGTDIANVKVKILNASGEEIFSETIHKTSGFVRPYNFETMAEGDYSIITDDGTSKKIQKFKYRQPVKEKAANVVQLKANKYLLAVKGQYVSGKINVKIYNGQTLVHNQQSDVHGDFSQLFTIKNITDAVRFEVTNDEGETLN